MSDPFAELDTEMEVLRQQRQTEALQFFKQHTEDFIVKTVQALDKVEFTQADAAKFGIQSGTGQGQELLYAIYQGQGDDPGEAQQFVEYVLDQVGFPQKNELTEDLYDNAMQRMLAGKYTMPEVELGLPENSVLIKKELITNRDIVEGVSNKVADEMGIKPDEVIDFIQDRSIRDSMPEAQKEAIEASIVHAVQEDFPGIYRSMTAFLTPMTEERIESQVIGRMNGIINGMEEPQSSVPAPSESELEPDVSNVQNNEFKVPF